MKGPNQHSQQQFPFVQEDILCICRTIARGGSRPASLPPWLKVTSNRVRVSESCMVLVPNSIPERISTLQPFCSSVRSGFGPL
jgi:hypothetical protein